MLINFAANSFPHPQSKRPLLKRGRTDTPANGEQGAMMESATEKMLPPLELPSNATSIRAEITDTFSCENRGYGYYADVENECQIFHVCLPVMNADERKERTFRWSFICPEETVFSQQVFTCVRMEDMPNECKDSEQYYQLNNNFGMAMSENGSDSMKEIDSEMMPTVEGAETENSEDMQQQQMMIEKIEMTTEAKMIMEEKKPVEEAKPAVVEKPVMDKEKDSNIKVIIRGSDMTQGLLPPLSNEVYRAGTNGEAQMVEPTPIEVTVVESALTDEQLDEVQELDGEPLPTVVDLKESVIQAVENIIEEHSAAQSENVEATASEKKMRRIPDPRGRRFLFRADAKKGY